MDRQTKERVDEALELTIPGANSKYEVLAAEVRALREENERLQRLFGEQRRLFERAAYEQGLSADALQAYAAGQEKAWDEDAESRGLLKRTIARVEALRQRWASEGLREFNRYDASDELEAELKP